MLFYIRFRGQLRRTRPELIASLEGAVTKAVSAAGGVTEAGRKVLVASFDEDRIGFWLDMVIFLERVHKALEKAAGELYGYALALGRGIPESSVLKLCRSSEHPRQDRGLGIWCSEEVCRALDYYMVFDSASRSLPAGDSSESESPSLEEYRELLEWRSFYGEGPPRSAERPEDTPPLTIRFGAGGCALVCFADAFTPQIRSFIAGAVSADALEELDSVHAMLFRERLRQELSPYMASQTRRFIAALLTAYSAAVKTHGALILEALHLADAGVFKVFKEVYASLGKEKEVLVLAAADSTEKSIKSLSDALNHVIVNAHDDVPVSEKIKLKQDAIPQEILEVSYNIVLLGQYFPDYLFPQLFEEEGLDREMYFRALAMLASLGAVTGGRSGMPAIDFRGEKVMGERKNKIRRAVRKIILAWVGAGKIRPCFNLLAILSELGDRAEDDLILRSLRAEVFNGTPDGIEKALKKGRFESLVGAGNAPVLTYIYKTLRALACGEKTDIQQAFGEQVPSMIFEDNRPCYGAYQAQVQVNFTAYYTGIRSIDAASEAVRKAMFLNRDLGKNAVPAYRLFSLVHLSRQRIDDAQEYISFALEQAESMEQAEELVFTCYFAASINFLYGNLSKAERLAVKAQEAALVFGQSAWLMRARFIEGRIKFEIGQYADALETFESLDHAIAAGAGLYSAAMVNTVRAWIYRAKVYLNTQQTVPLWNGVKGASPSDGRLFEIEAAYFAKDYEKAKSLAESFLSSSGEEQPELYYGKHFLFTEQPDWRSGFAQCENLLLREKAQGTRMAWIYRAMAQCALNPSKEARAELLSSMQRFMRDELLPDTDPNDPFYFYAWFCMLRDSGADEVDMNTVVSMAHKRLQRRVGRIDDMKVKQAFLNLSCWSSTLRQAARDYKLI